MANLLEKIIGTGSMAKREVDEYSELDLSEFEEDLEDVTPRMYIRIAELTGLEQLPDLKKEVYGGNALLIDISNTKRDKLTLERSIKELKQVIGDLHGDIAGIGEDQILVTPKNVKIDRTKVIGGRRR
ncbi:hypothetical protein B6V01_004990 [Methanosarcinales archaeon ex4572_44]|nr:MAG: hypothetical protein B6U67_00680 [Methanosarcinales archaeon ex4484_138]PHP45233.1 MAG: hypothetical protein B6V01_004990 [Methanosarcinales archaeon ex4572_44]RLG26346.1 MAG: hypothetical protein DRN85_03235 [Methanosarcinales archaeon]